MDARLLSLSTHSMEITSSDPKLPENSFERQGCITTRPEYISTAMLIQYFIGVLAVMAAIGRPIIFIVKLCDSPVRKAPSPVPNTYLQSRAIALRFKFTI